MVCEEQWRLVAAEMKNMWRCAFIHAAACHRKSCPGLHVEVQRWHTWWLIMLPSFSPPPPRGDQQDPRRHVLRLSVVRFLLSRGVFHASANCTLFLLQSVVSLLPVAVALTDLPQILVLYSLQFLFVPDIKDLFLSFSRAFGSGGPGLVGKILHSPDGHCVSKDHCM